MEHSLIAAFATYFSMILVIGYLAYKKSSKAHGFTLGNRSLSFWVTALAAHASETSSFLFMALPSVIYTNGLIEGWTTIGLTFFMFLNWRFVAPKLRSATEKLHSNTLSSFFENRFNDKSGLLRIVSAVFCLLYLMFYIAAGLVAMGILFESIFGIPYIVGILLGTAIVFCTLLGGYLSISWIDFFQGMFLLATIIIVPLIAFSHCPGVSSILAAAQNHHISLSLLPDFSWLTIKKIILLAVGWGLGYFGQPQILTKFMGISNVHEMRKAQWVGICWQTLSYLAAICVGLIGLAFFKDGAINSQLLFVGMAKQLFPQFIAGLILCAIIAAAINVMSAQVLVSASIIAEDFYKKSIAHNNLSEKKIARISRVSVFGLCILAGTFAFFNHNKTIYDLTLYAWTGLGCSFGPLVLVSLHTRISNKYAALAGLIVGGVTAGIWPLINTTVPAMIIGFCASLVAIFITAKIVKD